MSAPAGSVNKETYTYTGGANTIYLYSANSGINIYGVNVTFPENPSTAISETSVDARPATTKLLRNGEILILRDGKTYNIVGQER